MSRPLPSRARLSPQPHEASARSRPSIPRRRESPRRSDGRILLRRRVKPTRASPPPPASGLGLEAASQPPRAPTTTMAMALIRLAIPQAVAASSSPASSARPRGRVVRMRVRCRAGGSEGGDGEGEGEEEAPESMFAKELRRRGMAPGSASAPGEKKAGAAEAEEGGRAGEAGRKRVAAAEFERAAAGAEGQRERSMALNSEGLEGLVPRAKLLLSLGGTFFLGFGPLIIGTVSIFAVLYVYFGPSFVHDASKTPVSPPPYIDPYELLEDERLTRPSPDVF
ncbi:hypothetical protein GUJ93_ZPchr0011g28025 [Zizania palustris]|uniref:Uncharacterized protein n=1 Tax=Zizania palustris TaxID=103762 RepID=A0A8J6BKY2_ZIZPA|nr:hypothetical protein GUJ93_ZPchr0011g28025 [Zizania palustris]